MASLMEELLEVLGEEEAQYEALIELGGAKKDAVIRADIEQLGRITVQEQDAASMLLNLSNKRTRVLNDMATVLGKEPSDMTIAKMIGYLEKQPEEQRQLQEKQEQLLKQEGLKVLLAAHSYVVEDAAMGCAVTDYLKGAGVIPLRADLVDRDAALKHSRELSPTCKWEISREILGGVSMLREQADGIILLSAFPCGPDAMVNELIARRVKDVPILNLVVDSQTGTAGVETRLESFIDIIRFQRGDL